MADQFVGGAGAKLQFLVFAAQAVGLDGAVDQNNQAVGLERFFDEVIGAVLDGGDSGFDITVAAHYQNRDRRMIPFQDLEDAEAVHLASLKPDIQQH